MSQRWKRTGKANVWVCGRYRITKMWQCWSLEIKRVFAFGVQIGKYKDREEAERVACEIERDRIPDRGERSV